MYIYIRTLVSDRFKLKVGSVVGRFDDFARGSSEYIYTYIVTSLYTFLTYLGWCLTDSNAKLAGGQSVPLRFLWGLCGYIYIHICLHIVVMSF